MLWLWGFLMGIGGFLLGLEMLFDEKHDYIQGRYIGFLAVLFAASAVFHALHIWKEKVDNDVRAQSK
jgi:hypothetical protein